MTLSEFLTLATQVTMVLIAAITLTSYLRSRDQARLDIALLFSALAFIVLGQRLGPVLTEINEGLSRWLTVLTQIALMSHPYLLLRLVQDFRPVPPWMRWFALGGMLLFWAGLIIIPPPLPSWFVIVLVLYFAVVELYAVAAFVNGARLTAGVTHWRLILAASGSGLLALAILISGFSRFFPGAQSFISPFNQFLALMAMLSYYTGFATPYWLRRFWQLSELQRFLRQTAGPWTGEPIVSTLERLCRVTVRSVGGMAAMVVLWNEQDNTLKIRASTDNTVLPAGRKIDSTAVLHAWETQSPVTGSIPGDFTAEQAPIATAIGARSTMIVPITTKDHPWGILQVYNRRKSLFADDDLRLLSLFAEQTAIALGYATLVTEQRNLIRQLSQRTNQLESAYKELESFSYSISHDLRSPLRHISGYMELLQKHMNTALDDKSRRYLTITVEEAGRMSALIDDLLAFSRHARTELHHVDVDFAQLVQDVITGFEQEQQNREVNWRIHPLPAVRGDRAMFRLVWTNLISNALKFSREQAQTEIEIGYQSEPDELVFYICDNGTGFNMQHAGQLFGVFQRLHHNTSFEGTGIGLATVQRIIQRHGGRTWAEGKENEGATFYFTLPIERAVMGEPVTAPAAARRVENAGGY